jgi:hypothetical protein
VLSKLQPATRSSQVSEPNGDAQQSTARQKMAA